MTYVLDGNAIMEFLTSYKTDWTDLKLFPEGITPKDKFNIGVLDLYVQDSKRVSDVAVLLDVTLVLVTDLASKDYERTIKLPIMYPQFTALGEEQHASEHLDEFSEILSDFSEDSELLCTDEGIEFVVHVGPYADNLYKKNKKLKPKKVKEPVQAKEQLADLPYEIVKELYKQGESNKCSTSDIRIKKDIFLDLKFRTVVESILKGTSNKSNIKTGHINGALYFYIKDTSLENIIVITPTSAYVYNTNKGISSLAKIYNLNNQTHKDSLKHLKKINNKYISVYNTILLNMTMAKELKGFKD